MNPEDIKPGMIFRFHSKNGDKFYGVTNHMGNPDYSTPIYHIKDQDEFMIMEIGQISTMSKISTFANVILLDKEIIGWIFFHSTETDEFNFLNDWERVI